jgi:hypothetical protein
MPAELSTPQVAPFAVTRHWSSQLDDQATTAQSLLGSPATFKDNPGPAYIWRSDDRDRNIGALHLGLGTVDASVIAVAERLGVTIIATLDRRYFSVVRLSRVFAF